MEVIEYISDAVIQHGQCPSFPAHKQRQDSHARASRLTAVAGQPVSNVLWHPSDGSMKHMNELFHLSIKKENTPTTIVRLNSN